MNQEQLNALIEKLPEDQKNAYNALSDENKKLVLNTVSAAIAAQEDYKVVAVGIPVKDTASEPKPTLLDDCIHTACIGGIILALIAAGVAAINVVNKYTAPTLPTEA